MSAELLAGLLALAVLRGKKPGEQPASGGSSNVTVSNTVRARTLEWRELVSREAEWPHLRPSLILAVIARESGGAVEAVGSAGEVGLMQVTKEAWQDYQLQRNDPEATLFPADLQRASVNIRVGSWYLSQRIGEMGNEYDGLRAYNCGAAGARRNVACGAAYAKGVRDSEPVFK